MPPQKRNVLPNTYIPVLLKKTLSSVLSRLPNTSLIELTGVWPKLLNTQPHLDKENSNQRELNRAVQRSALEMKGSAAKWPKKRIIERILLDFWARGLNLLQLSQVDCQLIVDRPNAYYWIKSTVKDSMGKEMTVLLNPQSFLERLAADLSAVFMTYIYVCRHPSFPLIIIRIQVFDIQPVTGSGRAARPHITSQKPYFFAIPLNSPHIIHSPGNDMVAKIVMQVVERSLPQSPRNLLKLDTPENQKPIRSLESMHILNGSSRFGNSLGVWAPYADAIVDISPLQAVDAHSGLKNSTAAVSDGADLKKIANLRFKGSLDGRVASQRLYDDNRPLKKRKRGLYNIQDEGIEEHLAEDYVQKNEYTSIAPIQFAEFVLQELIGPQNETSRSSVKFKLIGSDVFAGLHELSVATEDADKAILHPTTIPSWLTGEEGASCGVIQDGRFTKH